jgi:hypothetical protein
MQSSGIIDKRGRRFSQRPLKRPPERRDPTGKAVKPSQTLGVQAASHAFFVRGGMHPRRLLLEVHGLPGAEWQPLSRPTAEGR